MLLSQRVARSGLFVYPSEQVHFELDHGFFVVLERKHRILRFVYTHCGQCFYSLKALCPSLLLTLAEELYSILLIVLVLLLTIRYQVLLGIL